ncbi:hypothetical protein [Mycobacterium lepromatosis]|uniref:hypothetical protein n=1 Tax=Mycobacterium lepromatosis TaxID=480418 RepID=UPI000A59930C
MLPTLTRTANPISQLATSVSSSPSRSWMISMQRRRMRSQAQLTPATEAADNAASANS